MNNQKIINTEEIAGMLQDSLMAGYFTHDDITIEFRSKRNFWVTEVTLHEKTTQGNIIETENEKDAILHDIHLTISKMEQYLKRKVVRLVIRNVPHGWICVFYPGADDDDDWEYDPFLVTSVFVFYP